MLTLTPQFPAIAAERKVDEFESPVTRMLLTSDGSTSVLLEAALGRGLRQRIDWQGLCTIGDLAPRVRAALRVAPDDEVFLRVSALCTEDGSTVSRHTAVSDAWGSSPIRGLLRKYGTPLEQGLLDLGLTRSRQSLTSGLAHWPSEDGIEKPCAARDCVLLEEGLPAIYTCEAFDPDIASIAGATRPLHYSDKPGR